MEKEKDFKKEWAKEFGFLAEYHMEAVYRVLVALAVSVADVGRLHRLLPDNCRLNHDRLIALCHFWRKWFRVERQGMAALPDEPACWAFSQQRGRDLTRWYAKLIMGDDGSMIIWPHQFPFAGVLTERGECVFSARLLDHDFRIGFAYLGHDELGIELRLSMAYLTEQLVPVLKRLPLRPVNVGLPNLESACLCYSILSERVRDFLIDGQNVLNPHNYHLHADVRYVNQDAFLRFVQNALNEGGVPVTQISSYFDR